MSRSDVVRRLRALASRGVPMSVRHLLPAHAELVGQALAMFGGLDRARAIAGLEAPSFPAEPEVIVAALRGLARNGVRLDVPTLSTMGEGGLITACVEAFGDVPAAVAAAGLGAPAERVERPVEPEVVVVEAEPVTTAKALEVLQATAVTLDRVPVARDLPPEVARKLTTEFGSVRFAYLALRVRADGAASTTSGADEVVATVSAETIAATAALPGAAGLHRRNVEAQRAAAVVAEPAVDVDALLAEVDAQIVEGAAAAAAQLKDALVDLLESFVDEVTALARRHTLESLLPFTELDEDDEPEPEPPVIDAVAVVETQP